MSPGSATVPQGFPADSIDEDSPVLVSPQLPAQTVQPEPTVEQTVEIPPPNVHPVQSLELRLRWLEALLYGVKPESAAPSRDRTSRHPRGPSVSGPNHDRRHGLKNGETLMRSAEEVKRRMDSVVEGNDGLRRFVDHYEQHGHLLTPSFALSGTLPTPPPTYQNMSSTELEAFLAELEPDIRAADRDMREIEMLEKKGVTAAGKLPDYEPLKPRLEKLVERHQENAKAASVLERRVASLMHRYASQVDNLSELFVAWDETLQDAEEKVARLERDKEERVRLGYE
ncbi:uncharacterized protein STEHIDRAFT_97258 [Stereum hirsutum FP-91666 SS1]|uniref:uncharacterized protein n=1 Tax=Stereum hirsutum (strain FP-91666) TaxID=721885 RepID=UPI000440E299|nr:uncharacterized protein STEHIDRAFT_97258 [Stereum hirsutum FP-91666 SS1]EIM86592.1 hypothetical protein STEHIDRAFT_97258 [Stereum hirsutum FP-91666 SS1]